MDDIERKQLQMELKLLKTRHQWNGTGADPDAGEPVPVVSTVVDGIAAHVAYGGNHYWVSWSLEDSDMMIPYQRGFHSVHEAARFAVRPDKLKDARRSFEEGAESSPPETEDPCPTQSLSLWFVTGRVFTTGPGNFQKVEIHGVAESPSEARRIKRGSSDIQEVKFTRGAVKNLREALNIEGLLEQMLDEGDPSEGSEGD